MRKLGLKKEVKKLTVVTQMAMEYRIKPGHVQGPGLPLLAPLASLVQRLPKAVLPVEVNKRSARHPASTSLPPHCTKTLIPRSEI